MAQYQNPEQYREIVKELDELNYKNLGWTNDIDFKRPKGFLPALCYYNGEGLTIMIDNIEKQYFQEDSSD